MPVKGVKIKLPKIFSISQLTNGFLNDPTFNADTNYITLP